MSDLLKRSPHYRLHVQFGAKKFFNFAGWEMPMHFSTLEEEVRACRDRAIVFDGHAMGELHVTGPDALKAVERVCINRIGDRKPGQCVYTSLCNEKGGIVDDLVVFCISPTHYLMTVAAVNTNKTPDWVRSHVKDLNVCVSDHSEGTSCIAVQGPRSRDIVKDLVDDIDVSNESLPFYSFVNGHLGGMPVMLARLGVTGELGYEIFYDAGHADRIYELVAEASRKNGGVLCGNSTIGRLRLEKVYVIYKRDIDESTNPYECGLGWSVRLDKGDFIGKEALTRIKSEGVSRRLMGLRFDDHPELPAGAAVLQGQDEVGSITAGAYSPTLDQTIALAYIHVGGPGIGSRIEVQTDKGTHGAEIISLPFFDPKGTRIRI